MLCEIRCVYNTHEHSICRKVLALWDAPDIFERECAYAEFLESMRGFIHVQLSQSISILGLLRRAIAVLSWKLCIPEVFPAGHVRQHSKRPQRVLCKHSGH